MIEVRDKNNNIRCKVEITDNSMSQIHITEADGHGN